MDSKINLLAPHLPWAYCEIHGVIEVKVGKWRGERDRLSERRPGLDTRVGKGANLAVTPLLTKTRSKSAFLGQPKSGKLGTLYMSSLTESYLVYSTNN